MHVNNEAFLNPESFQRRLGRNSDYGMGQTSVAKQYYKKGRKQHKTSCFQPVLDNFWGQYLESYNANSNVCDEEVFDTETFQA